MLTDLYIMSANPSLEASMRQNYQHRALTYAEKATSGKRRGRNARSAKQSAPTRAKGLFMTLIEGVLRT